VLSLAAKGQPRCPRCNSPLVDRDRNRRWLPFLECAGCCLAFELVIERHRAPCALDPRAWFIRTTTTLQPGRTPAKRNG